MIWKPIPDYLGIYEVSDSGQVRRIPGSPAYPAGNRALKPWINDGGYQTVSLYKDGRSRKWTVHRLIAFAFHGNPDPGQEACHGDGDQLNNTATNIRWGTRSENMRDMVNHGNQFNQFRDRTHCANGHQFTTENTLLKADGRRCRTCRRNRVRAWRERQKEVA